MKKTRNIIIVLSIVVICTLLVVFVGKSFAFFRYEKHGDTVNVITFNGLSVNVNSYNDAFNLTNARPEYDFDGMKRDSLDFTITNHSGNTVDYQLKVENDTDKQNACVLNGSICPSLSTNYIKYSYRIDNSEWSEPLNLGANNNIIFTDAIVGFDDVDISIKIWVDSTSPNIAEGKYFYGKIILEAVKSDEDKIKVTFDPNGGTIGIASKAVVPGEEYGNLPTPTREGYTFKGWNGKNIFNYDEFVANSTLANSNIDRVLFNVSPNENYTLSSNLPSRNDTGSFVFINGIDDISDASWTSSNNGIYSNRPLTFQSTLNGHILIGIFRPEEEFQPYEQGISNGEYWIQLEKGSTATPYEPYYITSSTEVVQTENHTLTAIWEAN